jgi:hypothetical protein
MEANGFEASGMDQNGLEVELAVDDVELPDDLKTLYAEVQADPRSFDTWVQLLTAAENTVCGPETAYPIWRRFPS